MAWNILRLWLIVPSLVASVRCQQLNTLFTVESSCDQYNLNQILADARTMLSSARNAAQSVRGASSGVRGRFPGGSDIRHYMRNAHNTFGTQHYTPFSNAVSLDDVNTLNTVDMRLSYIQTLLTGGTTNGASLTPATSYIVCDDNRYVVTQDAHDIDPSRPVGTSTQEAFSREYLYYIESNRGITLRDAQGRATVVFADGRLERNMGPLCSTTTTAEVYKGRNIANGGFSDMPLTQVLLCPTLFDNSQWWTSINVNPPSEAGKVEFKFTAGALIHENLHVVSDIYSGQTFKNHVSNQNYRTYGPAIAYTMANNPSDFDNDAALDTTMYPDAYRLFCEMSQFPGVKWFASNQPIDQLKV